MSVADLIRNPSHTYQVLRKKGYVGLNKEFFKPIVKDQTAEQVMAHRKKTTYMLVFGSCLLNYKLHGMQGEGLDAFGPDEPIIVLPNHGIGMHNIGYTAAIGLLMEKGNKERRFTSACNLPLSKYGGVVFYPRVKDIAQALKEGKHTIEEIQSMKDSSWQTLADLVEMGEVPVVFPEGGRSQYQFKPNKDVVKKLAKLSETPIQSERAIQYAPLFAARGLDGILRYRQFPGHELSGDTCSRTNQLTEILRATIGEEEKRHIDRYGQYEYKRK